MGNFIITERKKAKEERSNPQTDSMDDLLIRRLTDRNDKEAHLNELFQDNSGAIGGNIVSHDDALLNTLAILQKELKSKEQEIRRLKEVIALKNKNTERLNDELISGTIENNVLQQKLSDLKKEHSQLVERWLKKTEKETEAMNSEIDGTK
ncbi:XXYS1_4_G0026330.mRNA.1.CDS.1 [Saccharomyces cerevisiae]|nr:EM14S01-3B_G0023770.mRNA.1.CDS.1 [Saccharomyces cerevisiae]CAD6641603.1 XXYS1_4_G0026330.mRNA.1.CDS.1 [Saccharomyces cerevisiae]CAI4637008.1 AMH_1a_G0041700.mRNA.1.CDS.1 [Saccharomyces cerevisiae]CAI4640614.1 CEI_1a_G0041600.mRNA.1.CDS.1 [Saccharomyces cerevisiae]CAI6803413.1 AMH_1a_G0041700.mRNA.1.CDS.1 [Saccharomyces cerevisiae]